MPGVKKATPTVVGYESEEIKCCESLRVKSGSRWKNPSNPVDTGASPTALLVPCKTQAEVLGLVFR
jgi:hypothetical protein